MKNWLWVSFLFAFPQTSTWICGPAFKHVSFLIESEVMQSKNRFVTDLWKLGSWEQPLWTNKSAYRRKAISNQIILKPTVAILKKLLPCLHIVAAVNGTFGGQSCGMALEGSIHWLIEGGDHLFTIPNINNVSCRNRTIRGIVFQWLLWGWGSL